MEIETCHFMANLMPPECGGDGRKNNNMSWMTGIKTIDSNEGTDKKSPTKQVGSYGM